MKFKAQAIINAPIKKVWRALENNDAYGIFDPACFKIQGKIGKNNRIKIFSQNYKTKGKKVKICHFVPPKEMIWQENIIGNLLFNQQIFKVIAKDDFTSEIFLEVRYGGILLPLLRSFLPDKNEGLRAMVRGLKKYVENHS